MSVLIGANDVIDLFETVYLADPTTSTANAVTNELTARGARLGQAIAALTANNGPNVIVSTIPLMNLTPWALQQAASLGRTSTCWNVLNSSAMPSTRRCAPTFRTTVRAGVWWNWMRS